MPLRLTAVRLLAVLGLAASAASLADQTLTDHSFCGFDSGCEQVTDSAYGRPLGVPLPVAGLVGFGAVLGLTLAGRGWAAAAAKWLAVAGGVIGLALIVVQVAVLGRVCPLCLVSDVTGVLMAVAAVAGRPVGGEGVSVAARVGWPVAGAVAVTAPLVLALAAAPPEVPAWVAAHWAEGKVTVVEVADFECEHCKRADAVVHDRLAGRPAVHFVRIAVAMPNHLNSRPAALAYSAAREQGKGEEMAAALFAAPVLTAPECRKLAEALGLNMTEYDRAVASPELDVELARVTKAVQATGKGTPQIWVQAEGVFKTPKPEELDAMLARAKPYEPAK